MKKKKNKQKTLHLFLWAPGIRRSHLHVSRCEISIQQQQ